VTAAWPLSDVMTLDRLADRAAIELLVGVKPDPRYRRAGIFLPGPDGVSRFQYFSRAPEQRVAEIQRRILLREPWHWAYQVEIPKGPMTEEHQRNGTLPLTRPITYTTVLDAGLLYGLHDWLVDVAESRLNEVAIAYRPRRSMVASIRDAVRAIRERRLFAVCVLDVKAFYDSLSWKRLHQVIETLPADVDVKALLHELVEIDVVDKRTDKAVPRDRGIPQGLPVSPVLANLFMAHDFDHWVARKLRRLGAVVRRYADDIAIFAPSLKAAEEARKIVFGHIQRLGLHVKPGTGEVINLVPQIHPARRGVLEVRGAPGADHVHRLVDQHLNTGVTWLGLQFSIADLASHRRALHVDVDPRKVEKKTAEIQAEFDAGLLSVEGVHERLQDLRNFYRSTLSELTARGVVERIEEGLVLAQAGSLGDERGAQGKEKEEGQGYGGKIDPRERQAGGQDPAGRLSETDPPHEGSSDRDRWSNALLHRQHGLSGKGSSGVLGDGMIVEVPRRGGHRPRSPGAPTGTRSASPVPDGIEKREVTIRVRPRGPKRADVEVSGQEVARFRVQRPESISVPEMYLWAATRAFEGLGGDQAVTLLVTDPTLGGLLWDGWEPHSVPLARALVALRREADRLSVRFERGHVPRRRKRSDGPSPWT
jgi:hypothetical protein